MKVKLFIMLVTEHIDEKLLWKELKNGDTDCFNFLFRRYYSELYNYGMKFFNDQESVKEAIQEIFIRIWETRERLGEVENLKAYLLVSLRRMMLVKRGKDRSKLYVEYGKIDHYSFFFELNEFEKHEELSPEVRDVILKSLNSLTKRQRELIQLFFYHGLPYPEIARIMKMSVQATRNLMYRTLIHLRESMGEKTLRAMRHIALLFYLPVSVKKFE